MFNIDFFKKNIDSFYYMFEDNESFVKARNEYTENIFIKDFFNKHFPDRTDVKDILGEIKIFYKVFQNRILNVKVIAVDYGIAGEYHINTETSLMKKELSLFYGSMAEPCEFEGYWNAYRNLDTMFTIFIQSNIKNVDSVVNTFIEKLSKNLSNSIKFENISYNDLNDMLFIKTETFEIQVLNFTDFIKGENLYYDINSKNKVNNQTVNLVNSIVKQLENLR